MDTPDASSDPGGALSALEGDYVWDLEYDWELDTSQEALADAFLLSHPPGAGAVSYCRFEGKLRLRKRKRADDDDGAPANVGFMWACGGVVGASLSDVQRRLNGGGGACIVCTSSERGCNGDLSQACGVGHGG